MNDPSFRLNTEQLPVEIQTMVAEIESFAGRHIEYLEDPKKANELWGENVQTCALWISSEQAAIISALSNPPVRSIVHEILHIRCRWPDKVPCLWAPPEYKESWIQGFDNDIEHLIIVPEERNIIADGGWWQTIYGTPPTRFQNIPFLHRRFMLIRWLLARHLLSDDVLDNWRSELSKLDMMQEANDFADAVMAVFPDKPAMWAIVLESLDLQRPWLQMKTLDPTTGKDQFHDVPDMP